MLLRITPTLFKPHLMDISRHMKLSKVNFTLIYVLLALCSFQYTNSAHANIVYDFKTSSNEGFANFSGTITLTNSSNLVTTLSGLVSFDFTDGTYSFSYPDSNTYFSLQPKDTPYFGYEPYSGINLPPRIWIQSARPDGGYNGFIFEDDGTASTWHTADDQGEFQWYAFTSYTLTIREIASNVPEPETYLMLFEGLVLLNIIQRRNQRSSSNQK
jgi:hypothetical protein